MYWNDGSIYKGSWFAGLQQGEGILQMPDGRVKEGIFHENKFVEKKSVKLPPPIMEEASTDENLHFEYNLANQQLTPLNRNLKNIQHDYLESSINVQ